MNGFVRDLMISKVKRSIFIIETFNVQIHLKMFLALLKSFKSFQKNHLKVGVQQRFKKPQSFSLRLRVMTASHYYFSSSQKA
jgi:hypothetical protein